MTPDPLPDERRKIEQAIAAQESLRGIVDDAIIDTAIFALNRQLEGLQPAPVEQQRKMVTILFADVVNSTRLLRELDPEENLAIMDSSLKRMAEEVEAFGGRVTRYMGDGFLAVFGLEQARENDPEMAVRAGLAVVDQARKIAASLESSGRYPEFRVRVGINTGQVVAGGSTEAEATLSGTAVNLAARLESAAAPNAVWISGYTQNQVRGIFDLEAQTPIDAKGFPRPIQIYQVLRAKPRAFRLMTRGIEGISTRLVGRESEIQLLQQQFNQVLENRTARAVTVIGEAGLGKSRLLDEFESWVDLQPEPILLFKGRSTLERMDLPFALLRDLLAFRFDIPDHMPGEDACRAFTQGFQSVLGNDPAVAQNTNLLGHLLGYDFPKQPELREIYQAPQQMYERASFHLTSYLKALSAAGPAAVFLDDLQWADESSLAMLVHLFDQLSASPVLFVALARPAFFEKHARWIESDFHTSLVLNPLSKEASSQLLKDILQHVSDLPDALRDIIIGNAEGNPFYLEELVEMFLEDGVIVKGDPAWYVRADRLVQTRIPATLTGVIQSRLESLPDIERTVIQQASVVGRVFWDGTVAGIQTEDQTDRSLAAATVQHALEELRKREIISTQPDSGFPGLTEYIFRNSIFRDVVYESVLIRDRKKYHGRVADWLILTGSMQAVGLSGLIAGHLEKAGRMQEALVYLTRAANAALANNANDEASDFYRRALAACPQNDDEARFDILFGLEQVASRGGKRDDQRKLLEELHLLAGRLKDSRRRAAVLIQEAWLHYWTSSFQFMRKTARQARRLAEKIGDPSLIQQSNYAEAWSHFQLGQQDRAEQRATDALRITRDHGFRLGEGNTLNILGLIAISRGNYFQAIEYISAFLEVARELKNPEREVTALSNLSAVHTSLGNYPAALKTIQASVQLAVVTGDRTAESTARINHGWIAQSMEHWELAREILEPAVASKLVMEHQDAQAEGLTWLGYTWLGLGDPDRALLQLEKALDIRRALEQEAMEVEALSAVALTLTKTGNLGLAQLCVDQILTYLEAGGSLDATWEPLRIYWNTVETLRALGDARYRKILTMGYHILLESAENIPDETYREMYLTQVPWHRKLIALWHKEGL